MWTAFTAPGDVCIKNLRQVVTAVSDGAVAATSLEKHVSAIHDKLNIPELPGNEAQTDRPASRAAADGKIEGAEKRETLGHGENNGFLSEEIKRQLAGLFLKFAGQAVIKAELDDSPLSGEMSAFLGDSRDLPIK